MAKELIRLQDLCMAFDDEMCIRYSPVDPPGTNTRLCGQKFRCTYNSIYYI